MSSQNSGHIFEVAHKDASRFPAGPVNLKDISEGMSHSLMGSRPADSISTS